MQGLFRRYLAGLCALPLACALALTGCEDDREIFKLDTDGTDVEVEQDPDTGDVDVDVDVDD